MSWPSLDLLNPLYVLGMLAVALLTGALFARVFGAPASGGRFASIDGLRGFLALGVFIQHAAIWYHYPRTGEWGLPPSNLFRHLGQSAVGLFFMITALLFTRKVLPGAKPVDWAGLYIGRVLRLTPLYLLVVAVVLLTVLALDGAELHEPLGALLSHLASWVLFTFNGSPDINGFGGTAKIVAGVTWTLPYEWLFYLALPLLALVLRGERRPWLLGASLVGCLVLAQTIPAFRLTNLSFFIGGIVAALCVERDVIGSRLRGPLGTALTVGCTVAAVALFDTAYRLPVAALLTLAFLPLVCGNTLFGLLVRPTARTLGELTYGLYLWHGVALYFLFKLGAADVTALSVSQHWLAAAAITPALLLWCHWTYRWVERPCIDAAPRVMAWIRTRRSPPSFAATTA